MYFKHLLFKSLLVVAGLCVGTSTWAETIATLGNVNQAWVDNNTSYTVAANKTLTLNFTVSSVKGTNANEGYYVDLKQNNEAQMAVECSGGFYNKNAVTESNNGWWNWGYNESFDCSWWSGSYADNFKDIAPGAVVELTIKRFGTQVTYFADITTTSKVRHYLRIISPENTLDEDEDLTVVFGANNAVLTGITDEITDESITGTLIGREDNHADFNGTNAVNQAFTLGADESLELNFINYSSKIGYGDNWYLRVENGSKYFDLRSDYWGGESDGAGYYFRTEEDGKAGKFTLTSSTGAYFDNFPKALHKASVKLTVARSSSTITITAVQTCTSGEVKTQTYTLTHSDFASGDVTVRLYAAWSHLDLLPVSKTITSAGWATYCSPYALNLAAATGLTDAYIITGGKGGVLDKTSVKNGTVPANTGLLLKGDAGTANIPIVGSSTTNVSTNKLVGVLEDTEIAQNTGYVLMNDATNGLGFYKNANATAFTVGANTAYLPADFADAGAGARSFYLFDDELTGIKNIESAAQKAEGDFFDLQGRKVAQPTKGLYIVNGKKVIIK